MTANAKEQFEKTKAEWEAKVEERKARKENSIYESALEYMEKHPEMSPSEALSAVKRFHTLYESSRNVIGVLGVSRPFYNELRWF